MRDSLGFAGTRFLETVPGIGAYAAMVILVGLGDVERFQNKRALASYAGLMLVVREPAGKRKRGGITHQGSNTLRWIMAQVARIALARKLLTVVWALLHHGVCYDEELFIRG